MITYYKLGKRGNLGNQMFQIASTIGIARSNKTNYFFPKWAFSMYFKNPLPTSNELVTFTELKEKQFNFYNWNLEEKDYNIDGWLQTERYFNRKETERIFEFKDDFIAKLRSKYIFLFDKKAIVISIRRGDFVNHPYYFQLSYKFYFLALINNFSDWKDCIIIFASDDLSYCKYHFSFIKNSFFLENLSPIEQLALCSQFENFVISNSTFSWWMAWLGENENSKIVRPIKNFRDSFAEINNDIDYFPRRWIPFDENSKRIEFKRYFKLIIKGTLYTLLVNFNYFIKKNKKSIKKILKHLINKRKINNE